MLIFLAVNLVAFAVVNAFWQYLTTGSWLNFSMEAYSSPFSEIFIQPLSVLTHPWMIVVGALLLAVIFFVPIVVSVLYHEFYAILFVFVVAGLGHALGLAFFQACGCILAARTRLRSDMPFVAALLGLTPLIVYIYIAFSVVDFPAALPLQRWILCIPVVVAVLLAIFSAAAVLALAKLTSFRPGVVWPVLAVLLAGPFTIFYTYVGADELEYVFIAKPISGADSLFESIKLDSWQEKNRAEGLNRHTLKNRIQEDMDLRKRLLMQKCERFIERHGDSPRSAAVLWLEAQAQSLALDEAAYHGQLVKYNAAFPSQNSRSTWRRLMEDYRPSPHAALAAWRLGELALRRRDIEQADDLLHKAAQRLRTILADVAKNKKYEEPGRIFTTEPSIPARYNYEYYENALLAVERLLWLMKENNVLSDKRSAEAMAAYLDLNPRVEDYSEKLSALAGLYENTKIGDNLKLAVAQATQNRYQRAEMLIALSENRLTDAAIEANFALGRLAMKTASDPALPLIEKLKKPQEYFKVIIAARDNPWQRRAFAQLAWLTARTTND